MFSQEDNDVTLTNSGLSMSHTCSNCVTNNYGESRDSSVGKSQVPVQNQSTTSPKVKKCLVPLCNQTVNLKNILHQLTQYSAVQYSQ